MKISKYEKIKIKCICGCLITKSVMSRHRKTWSHFYYLGKLEEYYVKSLNS